MVEEDGHIPLIDIGTLARIRDGAIGVRPAVKGFTAREVEFADDRREPFDAVILATGFRTNLSDLLPDSDGLFEGNGRPVVSGAPTAESGLYFCGQVASATGQLRQINREASAIARHVRNALTCC